VSTRARRVVITRIQDGGRSIVIALYDEGKGQVMGNATEAVHAFVQYLVDNPQ